MYEQPMNLLSYVAGTLAGMPIEAIRYILDCNAFLILSAVFELQKGAMFQYLTCIPNA